ncbi:FixH family protein [Microvirga rosea]|uniref:FixH family protein n=1 Tax=Microvirga rosea TaxID=2715425 RepID=UPI001D0B8B12|nr:FixH family protein [Microvirga rosea]MCB8821217.1 FixH family protein [Microvirga rosea]
MPVTIAARRTPRPLTGKMVLVYLLSFFAVVIGVNVIMARVAVSSFSGVETESVYKAGLAFKNDVAAAQAQEARHWAVEAQLQQAANATRIVVTAQDAGAHALAGLVPKFHLAHPTDRRRDVALEPVEVGSGRFEMETPVRHGQWDLIITLARGGEVVFRSKSRISL